MKVISTLLAITVFLISGVGAQIRMYSDFSLKALWMQKNRFDYDSLGSNMGATVWGADSIGQKVNDWFPCGIFGVTFKKDVFNACIELSVGRNVYDLERETNGTMRYVLTKYNTILEAVKWYAEWHASDNITILTGRNYTPANFTLANRLANPLIGYANTGRLFIGARPMFQGAFSAVDNKISAKVALIKVDTSTIFLHGTSFESHVTVNETVLPKLEASVEYGGALSESGEIRAKVAGGFQSYTSFAYPDRKTIPPKDSSEATINSYIVGGDASIKIWKLTIAPSFFAGRNLGPYGVKTGTPATWWRLPEHQYAMNYFPIHDSLTPAGARLYNSFVMEWAFAVNFELLKTLSLEAGYEDIIGDHEHPKIKERWLNDQNHGFYGLCMLTIREKLKMTIEAGLTKYGKYRGYGQYKYCGFGIGASF